MNKVELISLIKLKQSFLCIGLDSDISKIPNELLKYEDPIFEFNKKIIDSTISFTIAYKPNLAFYESQGVKGMISLQKTMNYIEDKNYKCFTIADAKRADIGNTSAQYSKAFFDKKVSGFNFDAITVAPYMGEDSIKPFLEVENKWSIILALTSNKGSNDFQSLNINNKKQLFEQVIETSKNWGTSENTMFVVGATKAEKLKQIREIIPEHFLLVPGVGAQGGSLSDVAHYGMNTSCGLIVNASRSIIYASNNINNFDIKAANEAEKLQKEMKTELIKANII